MKKLLFGTSALVVAVTAVAGIGPRAKCDNEKSKLCDGLVAVYEFEEGLSSASMPTYPDAVRRNSFGLGDLYEPDGVDVGAGSTLAGYNNGGLGMNLTATTTPDQVTGLRLWLKADGITGLNDGDAVGSWPDSSGNAYNATQGTASLKPILKTGIVNGKPVVRFDGVNDKMSSTTINNIVTASTATAFVVFKRTGGTGHLFNDDSDRIGLRPVSGGVTLRAYSFDGAGDSVDKATTNGAWTISTYRHASGNLYLGVNDTRDLSLASVASGNLSGVLSGYTLQVGSNWNATEWFAGDIAEIIFYNTNLTEDDRKKVETYLAEKYGISIPYSSGGTQGPDADAVDFNGTDQYLHTGMDGSGSGVLGNAPWTVAFWVYPDTAGSAGQYQYIWSESGSQNGGLRYGTDISFYNNAGTFAPRVTVYDAITNAAVTASWGSNVSTGAWHLVVVTYRPRTDLTTGELTIQVDNGTRVTQSMSGFFGIQTGVGSIIGRSAAGPTGYFDGRLEQLTIAAIPWETADAASFFNGGQGREFPFVGN